MKCVRSILIAAMSLCPVEFAHAQNDSRTFEEQGFLGLTVREIPGGHTVVSWIFPGPLNGEGLEAPQFDLARPDLIVAINDEPVSADGFADWIHSQAPESEITIEYRRANERGGRIPDALNHEDEVRTISVTLGSRDEWEGTIRRGRDDQSNLPESDSQSLLDPFGSANVLGRVVAAHELETQVHALMNVFREWQARDDDCHSLRHIRAVFNQPFQLPEIVHELEDSPYDPRTAWIAYLRDMMHRGLDIQSCESGRNEHGTVSSTVIPEDLHAGNEASAEMRLLNFISLSADSNPDRRMLRGDAELVAHCLTLLRTPHETFYIQGPSARESINVIQKSMQMDWRAVDCRVIALGNLSAIPLAWVTEIEPANEERDASKAGVEGDIRLMIEIEGVGVIVVGGNGSNRYDMARIDIVIDPGGDDEYYATDLQLGDRVIIDYAGNDVYTGTPDQGPGGAIFGVSFIDDREGDDRYQGEMLAAGAAMFGVSLLLDRGGNDTYIGREWSIGAAMYGVGMIIDLGNGADTYLGDFLCQGVGGPRGLGCIIDEAGRDLYRANGPSPSAYGTPAVYRSFSQGIGFGYRHYAAGGIGMINDLGGDDRYEAGEFAQGGAYYYGLGILHDEKGNDLYYGNRYGQGFGVHQAHGVLIDDEGDDTYWSMTAASQGAGWDIGTGLLLDRRGNDSYQCHGLGQGGASQQAIGMLVDLDGVDRYIARPGATHGRSGANNYHWHETAAYSFSLLLDLGGDEDWYSGNGKNDQSLVTTDEEGDGSGGVGLFVDQ